MLEWRWGSVHCRLSLLFPALVTALLLRQSDGFAVSCILASLMHEGGHLLAMLLLRVVPQRFTLGAFGIRIDLGNQLVDYRENLIISVAGPFANAVAAIALSMLGSSTTAVVHMGLGIINLLPIASLDGGEILRCSLCLLRMEHVADRWLRWSSLLLLIPLMAAGAWSFYLSKNISLLVVSGYLALMVFFSNKYEKNS